MKKFLINILKIIIIFLPIFCFGNSSLYGFCVFIWPIGIIALLVLYVKNNKINKYKTDNNYLNLNKEITDSKDNKD